MQDDRSKRRLHKEDANSIDISTGRKVPHVQSSQPSFARSERSQLALKVLVAISRRSSSYGGKERRRSERSRLAEKQPILSQCS